MIRNHFTEISPFLKNCIKFKVIYKRSGIKEGLAPKNPIGSDCNPLSCIGNNIIKAIINIFLKVFMLPHLLNMLFALLGE